MIEDIQTFRCAAYWSIFIHFLQILSLDFFICKIKGLDYMIAETWATSKFLWLYGMSANNRALYSEWFTMKHYNSSGSMSFNRSLEIYNYETKLIADTEQLFGSWDG